MKYVVCTRVWKDCDKTLLAVCDTEAAALDLIARLQEGNDNEYWFEAVVAY